uniref:Ankyrin 2 n=1 Tax=Sinocyclocheilus rhinocerous TaxID=307959 RepID=A0A673G4C7_9TELE
VDTLRVVTEEIITTTTTVTEKHKLNVPETMTEVLDVSDEEGDDTMTGDGGEYLRAEDLRELGDDSLPGQYLDGMNYLRFSLEGGRSDSLDRSYTPTHQSYYPARHYGMMEDMIYSNQVSSLARENEKDSYSWETENLDNIALSSSPAHSGFLVSFMVDARGGAMRGCRHNGLRLIIPPRKCSAPTRVTCRLVKRHRLATMPPMVEGDGLASRVIEVGPSGAQFLGPVIVEIPHFAALRGKERELVILRSETGESWKEHHCEYTEEELNQILNGMDEGLDPPEELEKKRICRIITRDFPQYFAVVSRIKQDSNLIGPEGGILSSTVVPQVQAVFPEGALTKRIRVGLQAQPMSIDVVRKNLGNKATFSPIVTLEPRRRKFHKPITMTIPVPKSSADPILGGFGGGDTPTLRLLCSITGGTTPAQWEDITGTTPLTFTNDCVSFTTNVSARFWLIDCRQVQESVNFATQVYREIICVPYMAKFVIFAKTHDPIEARLRCFCMTDDKMDKTLEQQENFTEVARSRDVEVLEGKPIYVDCFGNLVPLTKSGQHHVFSFYAFKENRLALFIKIRDNTQEPCGRLSFTKEPRSYRTLTHSAICNLNITLPAYSKESDSEQEPDEEDEADRKEGRLALIADHLGFSWSELARELEFSELQINQIRNENPNSLQDQSHALIRLWKEREGKNATETTLMKTLTKINRMDIVHLIETKIIQFSQDQSSHTYAEIEQTISLDHSEGMDDNDLKLIRLEELNVLTSEGSPESINEGRSLSPDSPIPMPDSPILQYYASHFEPTMATGYRSTSNQTMLSEIEMQTDVFDDSLMDLRTSSPESMTLVTENRPLSPDSPIPEFTPSTYTFFIPESDSISTSSVSLSDENELYPSDLSIGQRPNSPESVISEIEPRPVSPDSLSDYREMSPHTAMSVVDHASPDFFTSLEKYRALPPDFGDEMPEIPPQTVTEEKYTDEYGNMVVKKITRKVIRKYVSADGVEREEVMLEGPQQEAVTVDEADGFSKVVKRTVVQIRTLDVTPPNNQNLQVQPPPPIFIPWLMET